MFLPTRADEPLPPDIVIELASILQLDDGAFIVGGQALNLWAELYSDDCPELADFGPFTSKDLDYFGQQAAASKLASALDGEVIFPDPDDATPNAALVTAVIGDRKIQIDFMRHVMGVRPTPLKQLATELLVPLDNGGVLAIPLMHPLHCLQSRIANVLKLDRSDQTAMRQLGAAPHVLEAYLLRMLDLNEVKEVQDTLRNLYHYLLSDPEGKKAASLPMKDPLEIISRLTKHQKLDWRYRWFNLRAMRRKIASKRTIRELRAT